MIIRVIVILFGTFDLSVQTITKYLIKIINIIRKCYLVYDKPSKWKEPKNNEPPKT